MRRRHHEFPRKHRLHVNDTVSDWHHIVVWLIFGADLLWLAQVWLGRLCT